MPCKGYPRLGTQRGICHQASLTLSCWRVRFRRLVFSMRHMSVGPSANDRAKARVGVHGYKTGPVELLS